jgi:hypothetical protein
MSVTKWLRRAIIPIAIIPIVALSAAAFASTASASPTPPFTQCPPVGSDTSCEFLIEVTPHKKLQVFQDPSQPPFGVPTNEDVLVGVQNNSSSTVKEIKLEAETVPGPFEFDEDGLCSAETVPHPEGCPFGETGYEGPNTSFTIIHPFTRGAVNFLAGTIEPGGSAYFSLEVPFKLVCGKVG